MQGAAGVPLEWLSGSPFRDYFIPSLILFSIVGGTFMIAFVANAIGSPAAPLLSLVSGLVVFVWLAAELRFIGLVSWLQPATALGGALLLGGALYQTSLSRL